MLPEFLTVLACLQQTGCAETAAQYRVYNPTPFELTERYTAELNKAILLNYWGPVVAYSLGREGSIKLNSNFSLVLSQKRNAIVFNHEF